MESTTQLLHRPNRVALVTGASRGLGHSLTAELVRRGWHVVIDARDARRLAEAVEQMSGTGSVTAVPWDVADPAHRRALADAVTAARGLDLLVNNASELGPSPQPALADYPLGVLERVYAVNTFAPLALLQVLLPQLESRNGRVLNVSSDAAVEAYDGWGGYGSAKAALDQLTAVLAVEHPRLRVYAVDPGDMATAMQQQAFPGEDISDRPAPQTVVPALLQLIEGDLPSGRYRREDLAARVLA
jgi:NAD(P)-dependent dehydrogenase (short-subunit alcohol dehydrogenase family)